LENQSQIERSDRPLRVGIDLTALLPVATGVDTYLLRLVEALARVDGDTHYTFFVNREDRGRFLHKVGENVRVAGWCLRPRPIRLAFQQLLLPAIATVHGLDVVHSPSFIVPMIRGRAHHLLTVYDMTFFSHPECHIPLRRSRPYCAAVLASLHRADLVTVPSRSTEAEILRLAPSVDPAKLRVVMPGIAEDFRPSTPEESARAARRLGLDRPYLLFVGTIEPRKNLEVLVDAYRTMVDRGNREELLVLAGKPGWGFEPVLERIRALGLVDLVRMPGYVSQDDLVGLISGARLFVYPSLAEGFGFPPLEAMACGVATIASDCTSLAENLEGAAELVPPGDASALTDALLRVLGDADYRSDLVRRGLERTAAYRWRDTALATLACYRELGTRGGSI
jgi:glycosyltransferase involved in cell wall biosynthesis